MDLVKFLNEYAEKSANYPRLELKAAAAKIIELGSSALLELDEASPMRACARCGKQERSHRMVIEEGDEWECVPCNEWWNAKERQAEIARCQSGTADIQTTILVERHEPIVCEACGATTETGKFHRCAP